ncbi:tRNA 2-thiouridine(34) synthase MnmA [bacterium]|nr:tRNA 2-thiouridine(34) synthase MnmA [bacterium]
MAKILVGLSGGVDSAFCAAYLKNQGHEVTGITMSIWGDKKIQHHKTTHGACLGPDEKEDIENAKKTAEFLKIPYYVVDCSKKYDEIVLQNFKNEYLSGKTPNPCVWCNSLIKFKALPQMAKETGIEFDKFATGHYARILNQNGIYKLLRAKDYKKDQSYFLYKLTQEQLKDIILPLGEMTKLEVRKGAQKFGLEVFNKPDSQDFFEGDYNELLDVAPKIGNIINEKGEILAQHQGIWNYTIGQRKGLGISSKEPLYVIKLDKETNTVVVGNINSTFKKSLTATNINYPSGKIKNGNYKAKIRSNQIPQNCKIEIGENEIKVDFEEYQKSIALGQSVVIYEDDIVVAGGIISKVFDI